MDPVYRGGYPFVPYRSPHLSPQEARARAEAVRSRLDARRSVRDFSAEPVPRELIASAIQAASTAPSGAHKQPWTFVAVSDPSIKAQIRRAAEEEERRSYDERMSPEWIEAIAPLGTDWRKPYLETAPWLVVLFAQRWGIGPGGERIKHYYVQESCGIAAGLFICALHESGLSTLTHTPSPMGFLSKILGRPDNERPMILFPIGHAAEDALVPDIERKPLEQVSVWLEGG
ncbi:MAG TPA: nitroreductase family protein [Deltaproteobacteria bacterium]|nr:nitroreductase family protein [Deltaproteobacteria bacterium]